MCRLTTDEPEREPRASTCIPPHHATHGFCQHVQDGGNTESALLHDCYHQHLRPADDTCMFRATILNSEDEPSGCLTLLYRCIAVNAEVVSCKVCVPTVPLWP